MEQAILDCLVHKAKRSMEKIGSDLREFTGQPDGQYFKGNRDSYLPISHIFNWTQSFFTGEACLAYHITCDSRFLQWNYQFFKEYAAKVYDTPLETMHDLGFLYSPYAVAMYQITGDPNMKALGVRAADELAKRFDPKGGYIRAWGRMDNVTPPYVDQELAKNHFFTESRGLAIVDCMMNLPLLFWASKVTGHPFYASIAQTHADTTLQHFIRKDGSVCHAWRFDEKTGQSIGEANYCGYGVGSHWARGSTWAIYGFAIAYDYTGREEYLEAALKIARRFIELCHGDVPVWDFRLPKETPALYCGEKMPWMTWDVTDPINRSHVLDSSAAAVFVCGADEILRHRPEEQLKKAADRLLQILCRDYADTDPEVPGMLREQNGAGVYTSYGDYYFMEALTRRLTDAPRIW